MDTINTVELRDEAVYPDEQVLGAVLGDGYPAYVQLLDRFQHLGLECEWRYYKDGKAWLNKVQKKKRTIVWMSAWKGYMQATVYVPLKTLESVQNLDISQDQKQRIQEAKSIGKTHPCTVELRDSESLLDLVALMEFKIDQK